jgi:hypothetical protein
MKAITTNDIITMLGGRLARLSLEGRNVRKRIVSCLPTVQTTSYLSQKEVANGIEGTGSDYVESTMTGSEGEKHTVTSNHQ